MIRMCEECKEYKSFDELPIELKEKFKSGARGGLLDKAKEGIREKIGTFVEA